MIKEKIVEEIIKCFRRNCMVFVCGNGGSAEMSNHFAGEMVNQFLRDRRAFPMLSLCSDIAVLTSIANDRGYQYVFSRQLEAYGGKGDILITLSTSGKSENILQATKTAIKLGMKVIPFPLNRELKMDTPHTQQVHLEMIHEISKLVEEAFL